MIFLDTEKTNDPAVRENFEKLSELLNNNRLLNGQFRFFEIDVKNTASEIRVLHSFNFIPTDIWVSWVTSSSTIVINYLKTDKSYFYFTSTSPCKVRFVVGRA